MTGDRDHLAKEADSNLREETASAASNVTPLPNHSRYLYARGAVSTGVLSCEIVSCNFEYMAYHMYCVT